MKKIVSILLVLTMVFSLCAVSFAAEQTPYGAAAYEYVKYLDQNLRERIAGTEQEEKTAEFIKGELESFGYDNVTIEEFSYRRGSTTTYSQNVVVTKPGRSDKQIIMGAHYDSVRTAGVDDNGSGVSVTLETAMRMYGVDTPYTIVFVFFGAEETGLRGSKAYAGAMTEEDIANTICMINLDSILAGTYRYLYSGDATTDAEGNTIVEKAWPFHQAMEIAEALELDMHSNDTPLNYDYPSPSTGTWSDHQSFRNLGLPYLYAEAANWELPDYPNRPQWGSSGAYETESGEVMHVRGRDDLTFIENEWGDRAKNTLTAYATLMPQLLQRLDPNGLLADKNELMQAINEAEALNIEHYSDASAAALTEELAEANAVLADDTLYTADQETVDNAVAALNEVVNALESVVVMAETETFDTAETDTAAIDISYVGDIAISSVRLTIDSEIEFADIYAADGYEMEYNPADGYAIIYAGDGSEIDGTLCTLVYDLNVTPWYAEGEYAIDIEIIDATDMNEDQLRLAGVDGALVIDNTYPTGDVTIDGSITNADVIALARYLVNLVEFNEVQLIAADVDGDGEIDNADLIRLARSIVKA
ncbi:MAG: M20/M25/M40 family metallo-hydrolase [Ruminococcaceae bacterium]|nr:M20/M25/M40 family metallo-hydrolase [Oscillospiraceae bacterium]